MAGSNFLRGTTALIVAAPAAGLSVALGAPPVAAGFAGALAAAGAWLAWREPAPSPAPVADEEERGPPPERLIDAIDDPVLLVRRQIVVHANGPARALLGAHIVNEDVRLAIRHPAAAERLTRDGGAEPARIELVGLGDRQRRWELIVQGLGGGLRLVRLRDRTDAHAAEKMRVDFVANASHELRTPLATLLGFIETLEDQNAAEDAAVRSRFLQIMFREAKRMQQLVDDLISLSRIEAEKYSAPRTPLDLAELIDEVCMAIRAGLREDKDRLVVEIAPDAPEVLGDRAQMSQLLHNLIGNALKYGRAQTPVRISLARARDGMAELKVADEGEGIPPEHLYRVTERFYRVDPGRSRSLGGTGLGLAIVKHIVERHLGRLDIGSEVGVGTTVSVLLPAVPGAVSSNCHQNVTEDSLNRTSEPAGRS
jgi:two-component system phosphate regulon sensor histidine kinase PhoR